MGHRLKLDLLVEARITVVIVCHVASMIIHFFLLLRCGLWSTVSALWSTLSLRWLSHGTGNQDVLAPLTAELLRLVCG